jgi:hypothetical protein
VGVGHPPSIGDPSTSDRPLSSSPRHPASGDPGSP